MSLVAPLCLFALLAIGVPLWVHRRRASSAQRDSVPSLYLYERSSDPATRAHRLEHLLLLALRCAIVALLAAAFAQPLWNTPVDALAGVDGNQDPRRSLHLIVIDVSLSMAHGDRLERARAIALETLRSLDPRTPVQIVEAGTHVRALTRFGDAREVHERALEGLRAGAGRATDARVQRAVQDLIADAARELDLTGVTQVSWVSDFQRTAMERRPHELAIDAEIRPRSVADGDASNWGIESVRASRTPGEQGGVPGAEITVVVRGIETPEALRELVIEIDGEERARRSLSVPASGRSRQRISVSGDGLRTELAEPDGIHRIVARLEGPHEADALAADDSRHAVLPARRPLRAGLIAERAEERSRAYLRAVLDAALPGTELLELRPEQVDAARLAERDVWVVLDAALPELARAALGRFLERDGGVLWFVGERLSGSSAAARATRSMLGARFDGVADAQAAFALDASETLPQWEGEPMSGRIESQPGPSDGSGSSPEPDPAGWPLDVLLDPGWRAVNVFQRARLEGGAGASTWVRTQQGEPVVYSGAANAGRALVVATSLDPEWSDLALTPLFARFVPRVLETLGGVRREATGRLVGDALVFDGDGAQVVSPDDQPLLSLVETQSAQRVELALPGFYRVVNAGAESVVAVDPDPRESDLRSLHGELEAAAETRASDVRAASSASQRSAPEATVTRAGSSPDPTSASVPDTTADASSQVPSTPLGGALLCVAAVLVGLESLLANRTRETLAGGASVAPPLASSGSQGRA